MQPQRVDHAKQKQTFRCHHAYRKSSPQSCAIVSSSGTVGIFNYLNIFDRKQRSADKQESDKIKSA